MSMNHYWQHHSVVNCLPMNPLRFHLFDLIQFSLASRLIFSFSSCYRLENWHVSTENSCRRAPRLDKKYQIQIFPRWRNWRAINAQRNEITFSLLSTEHKTVNVKLTGRNKSNKKNWTTATRNGRKFRFFQSRRGISERTERISCQTRTEARKNIQNKW